MFFRPYQDFLQDVTDAYIVAAGLDILDIEDMASPVPHPPIHLMNKSQKI
jgi:hypothetical protein